MAMADPSPSESTTGFSGGFVGFAEKHLRDRGAAPEVPVLSTVNAEVDGMGGVGVRDSRVRRAAEGRELEGPEPSKPGGGEWLSEMVRLRPFEERDAGYGGLGDLPATREKLEATRRELWEIFLATGADPDGADYRHLNPGEALAAVRELRREADEPDRPA